MTEKTTPTGKIQGIIVLAVIVGLIAVAVFTRGGVRERVGNWFSKKPEANEQSQPPREGIEKQLKENQTERDKLARLLYASPDIETGKGKINNTWIEQKIREPLGSLYVRDGIRVHVDFTVNELNDIPYFVSVCFFLEEDESLSGLNESFSLGELTTVTSKVFPDPDNARKFYLKLFVYYSDFNVQKVAKHGDILKYVVMVYKNNPFEIISLSSRTFSFEDRAKTLRRIFK